MIEDTEFCAGCGAYIGRVVETGVSGVYCPEGPEYLLCMACYRAEEDAIERAGTNDLPDRLAGYRRTLAAAQGD